MDINHRLKLSADSGNAVAQCQYGQLILNGRGVMGESPEIAVNYFKLSADQSNADGQFNYALCLQEGKGVVKDVRLAAHYFKLAADQEYPEAQLKYGLILLSGDGVEGEPPETGNNYLQKAAKQGNAEAIRYCRRENIPFIDREEVDRQLARLRQAPVVFIGRPPRVRNFDNDILLWAIALITVGVAALTFGCLVLLKIGAFVLPSKAALGVGITLCWIGSLLFLASCVFLFHQLRENWQANHPVR
jgi:hypothetical protein